MSENPYNSNHPPLSIFRIASFNNTESGNNPNPIPSGEEYQVLFGETGEAIQHPFTEPDNWDTPGPMACAGDKLYVIGKPLSSSTMGIYECQKNQSPVLKAAFFSELTGSEQFLGGSISDGEAGTEIPVLILIDESFTVYVYRPETDAHFPTAAFIAMDGTRTLTGAVLAEGTLFVLGNWVNAGSSSEIRSFSLSVSDAGISHGEPAIIDLGQNFYYSLGWIQPNQDDKRLISLREAQLYEVPLDGQYTPRLLPFGEETAFRPGAKISAISHYRNSGYFAYVIVTQLSQHGEIECRLVDFYHQTIRYYDVLQSEFAVENIYPTLRPDGFTDSGMVYFFDGEKRLTSLNTSKGMWFKGVAGAETQFCFPTPNLLIPTDETNMLRCWFALGDNSATRTLYLYAEVGDEATTIKYKVTTDQFSGPLIGPFEVPVVDGNQEIPPHLMLNLGNQTIGGSGLIVVTECDIDPRIDTSIFYLNAQKGSFTSGSSNIEVATFDTNGNPIRRVFSEPGQQRLGSLPLPIIDQDDLKGNPLDKAVPLTFSSAGKPAINDTLNCFFLNDPQSGQPGKPFFLCYFREDPEQYVIAKGGPISANDMIYRVLQVEFAREGDSKIQLSNPSSVMIGMEAVPQEAAVLPGIIRVGHQMAIQGTVKNAQGTPQSGLTVIASDKDLIKKDDHLGSATTDEKGMFRIVFNEEDHTNLFVFDKRPDIFFEVMKGSELILSTADNPIKNADPSDQPIDLVV